MLIQQTNLMLTVITKFMARLDKSEEAKMALCSLVVPTLLKEGCIQYDLHQCKEEPATFFLYENWADDDCLSQHLIHDYYNEEFREKSNVLFRQPMEIFLLSRI